ncbi:metallophosphoesterase family protein [Sedimentitalea todarodis]|uniref:Metallophosphoesterase family protein n=1 Tax=Sedimentitalea todarodis TaxID=1631240 RepID=A0ABU3VD78_9RHOB|nr:metallophosphoesterase family protein [Sedimentitalea todarodis]MDU9004126.1 metallophosphoesterase family protein [Sedimentitalea todarodis]
MTQPIYAVGDIHGQLDYLEAALDLISADGGEDAEIVFLGDLVDRGPKSRSVIERLMDGQAAAKNWHVIKGNHDRMFARFVSEAEENDKRILSGIGWLNPRLGGAATLASYGVDVESDTSSFRLFAEAQSAVPHSHLDYVSNLPLYLQRGEVLFVHAGIAPGVPLQDQVEDDLIWIRDPFLKYTDPHPWLVVHGHTALEIPFHFGNRVDLDGGAGYGRPIVPAVFEGTDCWLLSTGGRVRLTP